MQISALCLLLIACLQLSSSKYCSTDVNTKRQCQGASCKTKFTAFGTTICDWLHAEVAVHQSADITKPWLPNIVFVKGVKVGGTTASGVIHHLGRRFGMLNTYVAKTSTVLPTTWSKCKAHPVACCEQWNSTTWQRHSTARVFDIESAGTALEESQRERTFRQFLSVQFSLSSMQRQFSDYLGYRFVDNPHPLGTQRSTFLWALVREPGRRCLSYYVHKVLPKTPKSLYFDDDHVVRTLLGKDCSNAMTKWYAPATDASPETIAAKYSFLGLTERFDESMLVLKHLLNLTLPDMLYLSAKKADEERVDNTGRKQQANPPTHLWSTRVQQVLTSQQFHDNNQQDYELWQHANTSLDAAITAIGPERFNADLLAYRRHLRAVSEQCSPPPGQSLQTLCCLYTDSGCGYMCIERYVEEHFATDGSTTKLSTLATAPDTGSSAAEAVIPVFIPIPCSHTNGAVIGMGKLLGIAQWQQSIDWGAASRNECQVQMAHTADRQHAFVIMRDPLQRFEEMYHRWRRSASGPRTLVGECDNANYNAWAKRQLKTLLTQPYDLQCHFMPQSHYALKAKHILRDTHMYSDLHELLWKSAGRQTDQSALRQAGDRAQVQRASKALYSCDSTTPVELDAANRKQFGAYYHADMLMWQMVNSRAVYL
eukprot:TRINITY_DN23867_c0_g1_i1.p1 TRINITY_DN23867_c0_g1~~TRINITY_DN23867_c0_g1_i1.p1  ORF type:complete len:653 (+),score=83.67 TRINITY_DN23867_c0_g1_i1:72-2030(+)